MNINNLTGWVLKNQSVSQSISSISNTGIKNKANYSDLEFVEYAYHGIFGRAVDPSGLDTWTKKLNSGMTRVDLVKYYINHNEAKTIYSGWGYN